MTGAAFAQHPTPEILCVFQLLFPHVALAALDLIPHGCDEDYFPQSILTAQVSEGLDIPSRGTLHPYVSDTMQVYDSVEQNFASI